MDKEGGDNFELRRYGSREPIAERNRKERVRREYVIKNVKRNKQSREANLKFDVPVVDPQKPTATSRQAWEAYQRAERHRTEFPNVNKTYEDFLAEVKEEDEKKLN